MDLALQTLLDKQALYELSCRYMRGLDRTDAQLLHSVFWEECLLRIWLYQQRCTHFYRVCDHRAERSYFESAHDWQYADRGGGR